jgi:hypothetical protein
MYFQELGSPVGRIVKSDEYLKGATSPMVHDMCIFVVLQFACCAMFFKSYVSFSFEMAGNKNFYGTC